MTEQGTPEWYAERVGNLTASRVADATAKTRSGYGASRANLMAELIAERLSGSPYQGFTSAAIEWGKATEPQARAAYEFAQDVTVELVGYVTHPTIPRAGASPDGYVGHDGLVEFKCPNTSTHLETLLGQNVPEKYMKQMQWQMACTGRQWCDFVSFDPRVPERMTMLVERVQRDNKLIAELEREAREFLAELDDKIAALNALYPEKLAA